MNRNDLKSKDYTFVLMGKLYILFFLCSSLCCFSQTRHLDSTSISQNNDSIKKKYHFLQQIPKQYETSILGVISYFPELEKTKIIFKNAQIKTTLNVRPTIGSCLFRQRNKRTYVVRINNKTVDSTVTVKNVPFNAQLGLLGHEFCHIVDYNNRGLGGIVLRLLAYSHSKSKETYEKEIDVETIKRGLGWQLFDWANFIMYQSNAKKKYKIFKKKFYLEPEEIVSEIKKR